MNNLSWLLYLASVCESIGAVLWIAILGGIITSTASLIFFPASNDTYDDEKKKNLIHLGKKCLTSGIVTIALACVVGIVTPSKETVYAIAASEMGEEVLKSPTADKAFKALNAWLDKQITEAQ